MGLSVDEYVLVATRDNTRRSYKAAIAHFDAWGDGLLPATADQVGRYLAHYAGTLANNTLKQRVAALSAWHTTQGYPDPTKTPLVKKVMRGIRQKHHTEVKKAKPLELTALDQAVGWLQHEIAAARRDNRHGDLLRHTRDQALLLIGFWRGFRGDELASLDIGRIKTIPGEEMTIYLPKSKTDREAEGKEYPTPAMSRLCPVKAYLDWLNVSGLTFGAVFRKISKDGKIAAVAIQSGSLTPMLRKLLDKAEVPDANEYSSHSLRRGFATSASKSGMTIDDLMQQVGWKSRASAAGYIEEDKASRKGKLEKLLAPPPLRLSSPDT